MILFLFIALFGDGLCQKSLSERKPVRERYRDSITKVIEVINRGKDPQVKLIEFCIPETAEESVLFYSVDQLKESSNAFHILGRKIRELISGGNQSILRKYLIVSQFVDGYFAEAYFDHIEGIIEKQKELFCKTIRAIPQEKTRRLSEYKAKADCH